MFILITLPSLIVALILILLSFKTEKKIKKIKKEIKEKIRPEFITKEIKVCPNDLSEKEKELKLQKIKQKHPGAEIIKRQVKEDGYLYVTLKIDEIRKLESDKLGARIIAVLLIGLAIWSQIYTPSTNIEEESKQDNSMQAYVYCEDWVKDRLKAPSTADFPTLPLKVVKEGNDKYLVYSYVDAQNGFGAMIRTKFICETKCDSTSCSLIDLEFEK